jgi:sugar lactone lactonase YvrE
VSQHGYPALVDGPSTVAIVDTHLYVDEDFGHTLRQIDIRSAQSRRFPMPDDVVVYQVRSVEGQVQVASSRGSWRFSPVSGTFGPVEPDHDMSTALSLARAKYSDLDIDASGFAIDPAGNVYLATSSPFAVGRRIWRIDGTTGAVTTLIGPGTAVRNDPRVGGHTWYPKSLTAPTLDGRNRLWFLDAGRNLLLRFDLSTSTLDYVAVGPPPRPKADDFKSTYTTDLAGLAADAQGNVYAADHSGRRVVRIDPTGRVSTFAHVGGRKVNTLYDAFSVPIEPDDIACDNEFGPARARVEVADSFGGSIPGAAIHAVVPNRRAPAITDSHGVAFLEWSDSVEAVLVAEISGFKPEATRFKVSRGCTSTWRVTLSMGAMRTHSMF